MPAPLAGIFQMPPFSLMRRMVEDIDHLFEHLGVGRGGLSQVLWTPQVEVFEREGNLMVRADLPGLRQGDVQVELLDDALVLEGERRSEFEEDQGGIWRAERAYGTFRRVIPLPKGINPDEVTARFKDGVLEIQLKLPEQEQRGRRIEVQGEGGAEGRKGPQSQVKEPRH